MRLTVLWTLLSACGTPATSHDLSRELADPTWVMRPPDHRGWQRSSTDPDMGEPGGERWFANHDRGHVLRHDDGRFVLLDEEGPGVLTRLWSANPERGGTVKVVADGVTVFDEPFKPLLAGRGSVTSPWAEERGGGFTLRQPVPYAERLVVSLSENRGKGVYWVATGRTQRAELGTPLTNWPPTWPAAATSGTPTWTATGPGTVQELTVHLQGDPMTERVQLVVDGRPVADVPAGLLFGSGPAAHYEDRWRKVDRTGAGWTGRLRLPIPFRSTLQVGSTDPTATVHATVGSLEGPVMPLRVSYVTRNERTRPRADWTLAEWTGPGRVMAETLWVDNPVPTWWGGGDEKIWLDGVFQRGTGTEDLFGLAWCANAVSVGPFGGQASNAHPLVTEQTCANSAGVAVLSRARQFDDLPFQTSIRYTLGVRHREDVVLPMAAVVIGYAGSL